MSAFLPWMVGGVNGSKFENLAVSNKVNTYVGQVECM